MLDLLVRKWSRVCSPNPLNYFTFHLFNIFLCAIMSSCLFPCVFLLLLLLLFLLFPLQFMLHVVQFLGWNTLRSICTIRTIHHSWLSRRQRSRLCPANIQSGARLRRFWTAMLPSQERKSGEFAAKISIRCQQL